MHPRDAARVVRGLDSHRVHPVQARFCLEELSGRLVELSGEGASAVLSIAVGLVLDAQAAREPVVWVGSDACSFYPPDLAESGVDLEALLVVRIALQSAARLGSQALAVAAERLLRSGAFGLAQRHQTALLCLTEKAEETPSLGSLVSLRAQAVRTWLGRDRFACELRVRKDKRRGPTWSEREVLRGPLGLR
jgi:recombination protein RecA